MSLIFHKHILFVYIMHIQVYPHIYIYTCCIYAYIYMYAMYTSKEGIRECENAAFCWKFWVVSHSRYPRMRKCDILAELIEPAGIPACQDCARLGRRPSWGCHILAVSHSWYARIRECDILAELFEPAGVLAWQDCAKLGEDFPGTLAFSHSWYARMRECDILVKLLESARILACRECTKLRKDFLGNLAFSHSGNAAGWRKNWFVVSFQPQIDPKI